MAHGGGGATKLGEKLRRLAREAEPRRSGRGGEPFVLKKPCSIANQSCKVCASHLELNAMAAAHRIYRRRCRVALNNMAITRAQPRRKCLPPAYAKRRVPPRVSASDRGDRHFEWNDTTRVNTQTRRATITVPRDDTALNHGRSLDYGRTKGEYLHIRSASA